MLLGKHTYLAQEDGIRIVDWRNAPVSRIYYSYDEGDDYEESFGGRNRQGTVQARRSVTILDGDLRRIADSENIYVNRKGSWHILDPEASRLAGGQGSSTRAEGLSPVRGVLGVDADGTDRKDKHLPEIAALLDKKQFELISSPAADGCFAFFQFFRLDPREWGGVLEAMAALVLLDAALMQKTIA